jgi:putative DNA primase/helicase
MHGPQGTGKNLFFESVARIYGHYGRVVGQDAVEDKFNDWASRVLFIVADEVVAREEMYHAKNRLKGLITGDRIRINPKNVASYYEQNHVNLVFLSNEVMPSALERDDRRHAVIWTPPKWDAERYHQVLAEIHDGGIAALHDHLLHLDLGDFGPATLPPMTDAKRDLIELGMDSSERFWIDWTEKRLPLPVCLARSEDVYQAYRHWASLQGVAKPAQLNTCLGVWSKRPGVVRERLRHFKNYSHVEVTQSIVLRPAGVEAISGRQELSDSINRFAEALRTWRDEVAAQHQPRNKGGGSPPPAPPPADDDAPY